MLRTIRQAFRMIPGRRHWLFLVALAGFVSGLEIIGALMVYTLLELVVNPDGPIELPLIGDVRRFASDVDQDTLVLSMIVGIAAFLVFRAVVKVGAKYAQYRVAHNAGARLSNHLVETYLGLPYVTHIQRSSSEMIRNALNAVNELVKGIYIPIIKVAADSLVAIGMLIVLFAIDPFSTLLAFGVVGLAATILLLVVQPKLKRYGRIAHETSRQTLGSLQQSLHGIRDIKIIGREAFFVQQFARNRLRFARARYLRSTVGALPPVVIEAVIVGLILVLFAIAIATGSDSESVLSLLGLFAYAGLRLQPSIQHIIGGLNEIKHASAPLDDLYADLVNAGSLPKRPRHVEPLPFRHEIKVENVSFRYPGADDFALRDVDLEIESGSQIGVCGPTGGGKTTLVDVITGLLEPAVGRVTVDGVDIKGQEWAWQSNLGVVPQMIFLTDDTLRRNIALGVEQEDIDDESLERAVDLAQLRGFIESLPNGLETVVGERGVRISGGQRQRIAIARALYTRPKVLVFDEGTSALDTATEASLIGAIEDLRGTQTIIVIAHRLTSVRHSDKVVFIEDGRIAGVDTFDALERDNPRFRLLTSGG